MPDTVTLDSNKVCQRTPFWMVGVGFRPDGALSSPQRPLCGTIQVCSRYHRIVTPDVNIQC
ncbi:MAG: hypothetical protein ACD_75C01076G0001 [uncultured bacterium]|nr:MAG: hypothetical protein ACD_75C01076G0001 [uncultured bacterium]